jgi:hypothetical protein
MHADSGRIIGVIQSTQIPTPNDGQTVSFSSSRFIGCLSLLLLSRQPSLVVVLRHYVPTAALDSLLRLIVVDALHDLAVADASHFTSSLAARLAARLAASRRFYSFQLAYKTQKSCLEPVLFQCLIHPPR